MTAHLKSSLRRGTAQDVVGEWLRPDLCGLEILTRMFRRHISPVEWLNLNKRASKPAALRLAVWCSRMLSPTTIGAVCRLPSPRHRHVLTHHLPNSSSCDKTRRSQLPRRLATQPFRIFRILNGCVVVERLSRIVQNSVIGPCIGCKGVSQNDRYFVLQC